MSETNGRDNTTEEPQAERGPKGSRDEGEGMDGGPVDRPSGDPHSDDHTGIDKQDTKHGDTLPTGD